MVKYEYFVLDGDSLGSWGCWQQQGQHLLDEHKPVKCPQGLLQAISNRFLFFSPMSCPRISWRWSNASNNFRKKKRWSIK